MPEKALFVITLLALICLGLLLYLTKFGLGLRLSSYIYAFLVILALFKFSKYEK